jgi:hypothetical protein
VEASACREGRALEEGLAAKRAKKEVPAAEALAVEAKKDFLCVGCRQLVISGNVCRECKEPLHPRSQTFKCARYGKCPGCQDK